MYPGRVFNLRILRRALLRFELLNVEQLPVLRSCWYNMHAKQFDRCLYLLRLRWPKSTLLRFRQRYAVGVPGPA